MYAYIRGKLVKTSPIEVVIENNGIGYTIFVPINILSKLPQIGDEAFLYTSFIVREQLQALYGFATEHEKDLFEALINVSGIGPKTALSLIGHLSPADLHLAIHNNEIKIISKVPGIGKKTAERLIIEMRDKFPSEVFPIDPTAISIKVESNIMVQKLNDLMSALMNLGYNQATAQKAVKKTLAEIPEDKDLASLITAALSHV